MEKLYERDLRSIKCILSFYPNLSNQCLREKNVSHSIKKTIETVTCHDGYHISSKILNETPRNAKYIQALRHLAKQLKQRNRPFIAVKHNEAFNMEDELIIFVNLFYGVLIISSLIKCIKNADHQTFEKSVALFDGKYLHESGQTKSFDLQHKMKSGHKIM